MDAGMIVRIARGHRSRRAFAAAAGVPTTTISRIEQGDSDATVGMLKRLSAAGGYIANIQLVRVPTLAESADITPDADGEAWLRLRTTSESARQSAEHAAAAITNRPATADMWTLNLLAGVAEHLAALTGITSPQWCAEVEPLETEWTPDGTPSMIARSRATSPPSLRKRGIALGYDSIWSDV